VVPHITSFTTQLILRCPGFFLYFGYIAELTFGDIPLAIFLL